jgi:hypothetical protein
VDAVPECAARTRRSGRCRCLKIVTLARVILHLRRKPIDYDELHALVHRLVA